MDLQIRPVGPEDFRGCAPLIKAMGSDDDETTLVRRLEGITADPRWAVIGAFDGARQIGYVSVQDYGPHLRIGDAHRIVRMHDLYVAEDHRGRGIGRALLGAAAAWAGRRARYLEWQAGARTSAPFYEHLGYHGEPCPQPEYPTFVIDFRSPG